MLPTCYSPPSCHLLSSTSGRCAVVLCPQLRQHRRVSVLKLCVRASEGSAGNGAGPAVNKRSTSIHKLIEEDGALFLPGVYDALSGKIAVRTGHKAAFVSGYSVSATLLGEPDVGLLTPPELARKCNQISSSSPSIPIIADADTGGGNVLNVQRTIKQLIQAGAKGACLEDQTWPKKCGHMRGKEVIEIGEMVAKIRAARDAIGNADFFLIARTDVRATSAKHGLEEAIMRANIYVDAGADGSFVEAPRNDGELQEIGQRTKGIRVVSMHEGGVTPLHSVKELRDMGYHIILRPLSGLYAATRALLETYGELFRDGTVTMESSKFATFAEFSEIMSLREKYELEERYSHGEGNEKLVVRVRGGVKPHLVDRAD